MDLTIGKICNIYIFIIEKDKMPAEKDIDEAQEKHTHKQLDMNRQLQKLNRELALKEKLANQMISNNYMKGDVIDSNQIVVNEDKIKNLEKEKIELLQQLKHVQTTEQCSKLAEQRRQRVKELEVQISELKKKVLEQARLIKIKEKDELKIKQLNQEIQAMKSNKVKLIRTMKSEEQKFREEKRDREKQILRLKDQDRKLHSQMAKMETMHQKQQTVLKRKVEEAAAINKRLKVSVINTSLHIFIFTDRILMFIVRRRTFCLISQLTYFIQF